MNLECDDFLVSKVAFKCVNLCRYALEHPSQLTPGVHVMYACKSDKLPGKSATAGRFARMAAEAAVGACTSRMQFTLSA